MYFAFIAGFIFLLKEKKKQNTEQKKQSKL